MVKIRFKNDFDINNQMIPLLYNDNYTMYLVSRDINEDWNRQNGSYTGVIRYNHDSKPFEHLVFERGLEIISRVSTQNTLYFASIHWIERKATFTLHKLDCIQMQLSDVFSYEVEDKAHDDFSVSQLWSTEIHGLNERYVLASVPSIEIPLEGGLLSHYILIDTHAQMSYRVPDTIGSLDSILRMEILYVFEHEQQQYITFKTGRINAEEKESIWLKYKEKKPMAIQNIVVLNLPDFIYKVKEGISIDESYIIDCCHYTSGFSHYYVNGQRVISHKHHFPDNTSEIVFYNVVTKELIVKPLSMRFDYVMNTKEKYYGVKQEEYRTELFDAISGELLFSSGSHKNIQFGNDKWVITQEYKREIDKYHIQLHDLQKKEIIVDYQGSLYSFHYDPIQDIVTFFTKQY
jgi:hypothetical protein